MFDNSRYRAIIKSEQQKVRATTGLCCSSSVCCNDTESDRINNIELLSQVLIDNGNCTAVNGIDSFSNSNINVDNIDEINNSRFRNRENCGRNVNGVDEQAELANAIRIQAEAETANREGRANRGMRGQNCARRRQNRNPASAGNTNVYRFVNQNFLHNALGKSRVRISGLNEPQTRRERREQQEIENILRRYGRNCGCGR